jgi:DNA-binding transcriptional regulator YdaS (Cro superfamily)
MPRPVNSLDAAIAVFGGLTEFARKVGVRPSSVCQWRTRHGNRVPARHMPAIEAALKRRGLKAGRTLFAFAEPRRGPL